MNELSTKVSKQHTTQMDGLLPVMVMSDKNQLVYLLRCCGEGIAHIQSRQAKKDYYERLCIKYYDNRCSKIAAKITKLENELGYFSYVDLLSDN